MALRRVLANLIGNAIAYADHAEVTVEARGGSRCVTVDDDSPGILGPECAAVFSALHRADTSRNRATGGKGLGLAIAKLIVETHGGAISAVRSPLGRHASPSRSHFRVATRGGWGSLGRRGADHLQCLR